MSRSPRFLLTYQKPSFGLLGWLVLVASVSGGVYLSLEYSFPFFSLIGVFLILVAIENLRLKYNINKLSLDRAGESFFTFSKNADLEGLDMDVVAAVYDQIQLYLLEAGAKVPLRWNDRLKKDLKIDESDIEEVIAFEVARRTGRRVAGSSANPYYDKIFTVGDLILFFNSQPVDVKISHQSPL